MGISVTKIGVKKRAKNTETVLKINDSEKIIFQKLHPLRL